MSILFNKVMSFFKKEGGGFLRKVQKFLIKIDGLFQTLIIKESVLVVIFLVFVYNLSNF